MFKQKHYDYDLIIIGSGSGGSVAAHYAANLGKKVALFEKGEIGGECPNFACVPTKALLHAANVYKNAKDTSLFGTKISSIELNFHAVHAWKNTVVERTGVHHGEVSFAHDNIRVIREKATFVSPHEIETGDKKYSAAKFIIATGSLPMIPKIQGLEEKSYITFKQAVDLRELPKSIFILGGGPIACEFAQIYASFGTRVIIAARSTLLSNEDTETIELMQALFENQGITVLTNVGVSHVAKHGDNNEIFVESLNKKESFIVEQFLIATGKVPVTNINLEAAGVKYDHHGIKTNHELRTSQKHIYASGDVVGPYLFTHTGYYQSRIAAHNAFSNKKIRVDYKVVPRCVYTTPEIASVGMNQREAESKGIKVKVGICPIGILGRANTSNELDGFVKIITDTKGTILGSAIVGPHAGELIHEVALAMYANVNAYKLSHMIHSYPTFSEGIKIACSNIS